MKKYAVALGSFDGLHRGHMAVIEQALSFREKGLVPCALVFDVHPMSVAEAGAPPEIMTAGKRDKILTNLGVKVEKISFGSIMKLTPREFVSEILVGRLSAGAVCCGYNYHFGSGAQGDADKLRELCEGLGIVCSVARKQEYDGGCISSTRIREALLNGDVESANAMLGREFSYDFTVVSGDRRGRLIGAPTINQHFPDGFIVPKFGVYASAVFVDGKFHAAVTNIGRRPSFTCDDLRSETCIMDFSGDLYGKNVEVRLIKYLRPERVFNSLDELGNQIASDANKAREIFKNYSFSNR